MVPESGGSVTVITSIVAQSIYHQIARKEEEEEDNTNNAPGLQVSGLDLTLLAGLLVLLQSCLSASWDSFDDKFSLLPGVSTPLDQNTVKHSLVMPSVLASLNTLKLLNPAMLELGTLVLRWVMGDG